MKRVISGYGTLVTMREANTADSRIVSKEMTYRGDDENGDLFLKALLYLVTPSKEKHSEYVSYDTAGAFYGCGWRADSGSDDDGMRFSEGQSMIIPGTVGRSMKGVAQSLKRYPGAGVYCNAVGPRMEITIRIPMPFAEAKNVMPGRMLDRLSRRLKAQVSRQRKSL